MYSESGNHGNAFLSWTELKLKLQAAQPVCKAICRWRSLENPVPRRARDRAADNSGSVTSWRPLSDTARAWETMEEQSLGEWLSNCFRCGRKPFVHDTVMPVWREALESRLGTRLGALWLCCSVARLEVTPQSYPRARTEQHSLMCGLA